MNKNDFLNFSILQSYEHGQICCLKGYSIDYNPYRNIDFFKHKQASELYDYWNKGWESSIKN